MSKLDRYDLRILAELQHDARISNQDLAERIGLSPSPCSRRVKQLEDDGYIARQVALLDRKKLGLTLTAYVLIGMDRHTPERFEHFEGMIGKCPEVLECSLVTGMDADYQLKVGPLSGLSARHTDPHRRCHQRAVKLCPAAGVIEYRTATGAFARLRHRSHLQPTQLEGLLPIIRAFLFCSPPNGFWQAQRSAFVQGKCLMKDTNRVMQSYGRCCASADFFDDFYASFLSSSPAVREKFVKTDMTAQKQLLRAGILNLVLFARGMPDTKLQALGKSHSRGHLDIRPELYDLWIAALLKTIGQHDRQLEKEDLQAWRTVLNKGIDVIKSHY